MAEDDRADVWSEILTPEWEIARRKLDWMSGPGMHAHVASLLGGEWPAYIRDSHLRPLAKALGKPGLRMLSVGCGDARVDRAALDHDWPISHITCAERDPALVEAAKNNLQGVSAQVHCIEFDMNRPIDMQEKFDVIFFCHSIHHCSAPENLLPRINQYLEDRGLIVGMDYLGAPRNQPSFEAMSIIAKVYDALPKRLRRNLVTGAIDEAFRPLNPFSVEAHDPSEAPRSSDIKGMLFSLFPIVEIKPLGGSILRPILTQRVGNYVNETDGTIIRLMQIIEEIAISSGRVPSDDLLFVLGKSQIFES